MALKISLKPNEKLIVGQAVITNGNVKCDLHIENVVPVLREKDIFNEEKAQRSPCSRIYFLVQLMYIDSNNEANYIRHYNEVVNQVLDAAPSTHKYLSQINNYVRTKKFYDALKITRDLLDYEKELLHHATQSPKGL